MALTLKPSKIVTRKSESESLDLMTGADDSIYVKPGETFTGNIVYFVVETEGTVTNIIANDTDSTDIVAGGLVEGYKNINGRNLAVGSIITSGKYNLGCNFKSVTTGTAGVVVYYKYTISQ